MRDFIETGQSTLEQTDVHTMGTEYVLVVPNHSTNNFHNSSTNNFRNSGRR